MKKIKSNVNYKKTGGAFKFALTLVITLAVILATVFGCVYHFKGVNIFNATVPATGAKLETVTKSAESERVIYQTMQETEKLDGNIFANQTYGNPSMPMICGEYEVGNYESFPGIKTITIKQSDYSLTLKYKVPENFNINFLGQKFVFKIGLYYRKPQSDARVDNFQDAKGYLEKVFDNPIFAGEEYELTYNIPYLSADYLALLKKNFCFYISYGARNSFDNETCFSFTSANTDPGKGTGTITGLSYALSSKFMFTLNTNVKTKKQYCTISDMGTNYNVTVPKTNPFGDIENYFFEGDYRTNMTLITETENDYLFACKKEDFEYSYYFYDYKLLNELRPALDVNIVLPTETDTRSYTFGYDMVTNTCFYILDINEIKGYELNNVVGNVQLEKLSDTRYRLTTDFATENAFVNVVYKASTTPVEPEPTEPDEPSAEDKSTAFDWFLNMPLWKQIVLPLAMMLLVAFIWGLCKKLARGK